MHRRLPAYAALFWTLGCVPPPGTPALLKTPVTGNWSGTFTSSWGALPVTATIANLEYSQSIEGTYVLDGQRALGTLYGALQTNARDSPGLLQGSLTISYATPAGEVCRSNSSVTHGSATETSFTLITDGFPTGNCPDPPARVRIELRR
jgi:hypothetical protein